MRALVTDQRLEAIAGPPCGSLSGDGMVALSAPIPANGDKTLIAVVKSIATDVDWVAVAGMGSATSTNSLWSFGPSGTTWRRYGPGWYQSAVEGRTLGVHAVSMRRSDQTLVWKRGDLASNTKAASDETADLTRLFVSSHTTEQVYAAACWPRALTDTEVVAVMRWLARRYGIGPIIGLA